MVGGGWEAGKVWPRKRFEAPFVGLEVVGVEEEDKTAWLDISGF